MIQAVVKFSIVPFLVRIFPLISFRRLARALALLIILQA
ncbi:uncharacterized protein CTRU02_215493 [Colletotrichum truncatum]|uniref:Integral membrane protein n=1 Tax=Colletotrichum truncatum TaxID=5467 RepID=A0ACC3YCN3_COLTU|nr:uncharacterized protein CTRU02_05563 [Colletotrichum truncatum]KAF6794006.1 hypothetical protein CTRU02_05563 [Colletotrichum truncatum]